MKQDKQAFGKVAILGLGQMGASLAALLKQKRQAQKIIGYNRSLSARSKAKRAGWLDETKSELGPWLAECDEIFLCLPVQVIIQILPEVKRWSQPHSVISDLGSTKHAIILQAKKLKMKNFVGGHPMAGNEKAGIEGARPDLFIGKWWFIVRSGDRRYEKKISQGLRRLGVLTKSLDAKTHDRWVNLLSHLPHAVAYSLIQVVLRGANTKMLNFAGSSLRDFTRIAASSPEMWRDIFISNRSEVVRGIKKLIEQLHCLIDLIEKKDQVALLKFLHKAAQLRRKML